MCKYWLEVLKQHLLGISVAIHILIARCKSVQYPIDLHLTPLYRCVLKHLPGTHPSIDVFMEIIS